MDNFTIKLKVEQRLNKLSSSDYDNIEAWKIVEAFNKGTSDWCRRQLHGNNATRTGDEQTTGRIDDLQVLLKTIPFPVEKKPNYYLSDPLPTDYFGWKRISVDATAECCEDPTPMVIYLVQEGNIDIILKDHDKKPSFDWGESITTIEDNRVKIYTNDEFEISSAKLTYYKQPRRIEMNGISNPYTGQVSTVEVTSEFKDDIVELLIDECVKIISGDTEGITSHQIAGNSVESNN